MDRFSRALIPIVIAALLGVMPVAAAVDGDGNLLSSSSTSSPVRPSAAQTAAAEASEDVITFDEHDLETAITDQYLDRGVVFDSSVFITNDGAQPTSPVLSGTPTFEGPVKGHFTRPGSMTRTTVNGFALDVGYINQRNSTEVAYFGSAGNRLGAVPAQSLGINHIEVRQRGIASFVVESTSQEDAGFSVDNLSVIRTVSGIKPTRVVSFGDSYSSGEGLIGDKGLSYDCGTSLARRSYWQDTTAPGYNGAWLPSYCDTRSMSRKRPGDLLRRKVINYENRCHRHARAYPNAIRQAFRIANNNAIFLACSGAVTEDIRFNGQYGSPGSPVNIHGGKSQMATAKAFATKGQPNLVTVGIGGNDADFAPIIKTCMAEACAENAAWKDGVLSKIHGEMYDQVLATYKEIRSTFPDATVAAFGYPSVIGDPATDCGGYHGLWMKIEEPERAWLKRTVFPALNQALREAAQEAGVTFIDISGVTKGHEICSKQAWVNGLRLWSRDTGDVAASESFHPNELAHDAIAKWFMANFVSGGRLLFTNPTPSTVMRPDPGVPISMGNISAGVYQGGQEKYCLQGCPLTIQGSGYQPGATLELTVVGAPGAGAAAPRWADRSVPVKLAPAPVAADGSFAVVRTIPRSLSSGAYAVSIGGTAPDGSVQYGTTFFQVYNKDPGGVGVLAATARRKGKPTIRRRAVLVDCLTSLPGVRCAGSVELRLRGRVLARGKAMRTTDRAGKARLVLRLSKKRAAVVKRALAHHKKVHAQVRITATSAHQVVRASTSYRVRIRR